MSSNTDDIDDLFELIFLSEEQVVRKDNNKRSSQAKGRKTNPRDQPTAGEIELRIPSSYKQIVSDIENKYSRKTSNKEDYLIDITTLTVTDGETQVLDNLPSDSDSYDSEIDSDFVPEDDHSDYSDFELGRGSGDTRTTFGSMTSLQRKHLNSNSNKQRSYGTMSSGAVVPQYSAPQFDKASYQHALVTHEPPMSSLLFKLEHQENCLRKLHEFLLKNEAPGFRHELEEKILRVLGVKTIPSAECRSVMPFLVFDDEGEMHITFLFDSPPNTFWMSFLRNAFGSEYLKLQREVYSLARTVVGPRNVFAAANNIVMTRTDTLRTLEPDSFVGDDTFDMLINGKENRKFALTDGKRKSTSGSSKLPSRVQDPVVEDFTDDDETGDPFGEYLRSTPIQKKVSFGENSSRLIPSRNSMKRKLSELKETMTSKIADNKKPKARRSLPLEETVKTVEVSNGPATLPKKRGRSSKKAVEGVFSEKPKLTIESIEDDASTSSKPSSSEDPSTSASSAYPRVTCPVKDCERTISNKYNLKKHITCFHKIKDLSPFNDFLGSTQKSSNVKLAAAASTNKESSSSNESPRKSSEPRSLAETPLEVSESKVKRKRTSIVVDMDESEDPLTKTPVSARLFGCKPKTTAAVTQSSSLTIEEPSPRRSARSASKKTAK